ncbi:No apical meristem (NAM) protein [Musa troglodytarum]|uniref:No apical meristem (NAM) protein n=1 Tax=Musa troglodytarum TaxID=320322 RepID=A0A9E7FBM2_9LILI|nr:No apical meristem (NAM) protein [Musa troglodytarum]
MARPYPPGIRFVPTDQEVIGYFLRRLVDGLPVPPGVIHHSDIYQTEPWNLPDFVDGAEGAGYYYTPRHRMSAAADRGGSSSRSAHVRRTAGAGFWNGKSPPVPVYNGAEVIGHKTLLAFNFKNRSTGILIKTGWAMEEYILHSPDGQVCIRDAYVS